MFPTFDIVKELCKKQGISINTLEERVGFSRNSLYSWRNSSPKPEKLNVIADYFNVSTDYLLGRTDNPIIAKSNDNDSETPQYRAIQRKAKNLSVADQERLIQIMNLTFQDVFNGGENDDHDFK